MTNSHCNSVRNPLAFSFSKLMFTYDQTVICETRPRNV